MESILSILAHRLSSKNGLSAVRRSRVCFKFFSSAGDGVKRMGKGGVGSADAVFSSRRGSGAGASSCGVSCGLVFPAVIVSASALICESIAGLARIWSSFALKSPVKFFHRPSPSEFARRDPLRERLKGGSAQRVPTA